MILGSSRHCPACARGHESDESNESNEGDEGDESDESDEIDKVIRFRWMYRALKRYASRKATSKARNASR